MILNILRDIYHDALLSNRHPAVRAREYLYSRNINIDTIKHFRLGFSRNYNAYHRLKKIGITREVLLESRMFYLQDGRLKENFHNMIAIPVVFEGAVVHFTGRYVGTDWIALKQMAPHKHRAGRFAWGFNENEDNYKYVVITESPIDCMTLWQNKINSIATFGINGLSEHVASRIKERYNKIYIAYDKDSNQSGNKGAQRLASLFFRMGITPKIIQWAEEEGDVDVNSFFMSHKRADFLDLLAGAQKYKHVERKEQTYISVPMEMERIAKHYFKLKYVSRGYMVPCPYHKDQQPSMHIYTDTNEFYCYGCGIAGKPLQLIMYMEKSLGNEMSVRDAIQFYKNL